MNKFKKDYEILTAKKWNFIGGVIRFFRHRRLRFLFVGRLSASKNAIIATIFEIFRKHYEKRYGLEITFNNIEGGLLLMHPYNITINPKAIIGNSVTIYKGATIGSIRSGKRKGAPNIGDRVAICCNASVLGGIKIGNDVLIASNSMVDFDVPDNSVVIGNPRSNTL